MPKITDVCQECGNEYGIHSTDGARCPKNEGQLFNWWKLEFFATHFVPEISETDKLRARIAELEATRIPEDTDLVTIPRTMVLGLEQTIKSLRAELEQCKHALDDDNG